MLITPTLLVMYEQYLLVKGKQPTYGSCLYDLLVCEWQTNFEPISLIKKSGYYPTFRSLVHSSRVSGTLYRGVKTEVESCLDYSSGVASWTKDLEVALNFTLLEEPIILRCHFDNVPGLDLGQGEESEIIIGEMKFQQVGRDGKFVDVVPM
jgi:hypothetical protein